MSNYNKRRRARIARLGKAYARARLMLLARMADVDMDKVRRIDRTATSFHSFVMRKVAK